MVLRHLEFLLKYYFLIAYFLLYQKTNIQISFLYRSLLYQYSLQIRLYTLRQRVDKCGILRHL